MNALPGHEAKSNLAFFLFICEVATRNRGYQDECELGGAGRR